MFIRRPAPPQRFQTVRPAWAGPYLYLMIAAMLSWGYLVAPNWYFTHRDIDAVINRAQGAGNAEDMLDYLQQLQNNMRRVGMTSGHTALIFKTPANDVALHYKAVTQMIVRLKAVKDQPQDGVMYQVAMADIRGTIRELPNPTAGWIWVRHWVLNLWAIVSCLLWKSLSLRMFVNKLLAQL